MRCLAVSVAASWTGDTLAALLRRLIVVMGRPAAYLKDGGSDLHKAIGVVDAQGLARPCIDDLSHAVAKRLKRRYHDHPTFSTFVSACNRVSGTLTHTMLACLAPPTVHTTARCRPVHRLVTWAGRVLTLSPAGGAKVGSTGSLEQRFAAWGFSLVVTGGPIEPGMRLVFRVRNPEEVIARLRQSLALAGVKDTSFLQITASAGLLGGGHQRADWPECVL